MSATTAIRLVAAVFGMACIAVVAIGIKSGEFAPNNRYPDMKLRRSQNPKAFWLAITVGIATTALAVYLMLQVADGFSV